MNILDALQLAAQRAPHTAALYCGTRQEADYVQLAGATAARAQALSQHLGLKAGDRVAVLSANATQYLEALYATWWMGAVAVPINAKLHPREVEYILQHAGVRLLFLSTEWTGQGLMFPSGCEVIELGRKDWLSLRREPGLHLAASADDDLAWLFYTSGTTGKPKGAMLSHGNLAAMTRNYLSDVGSVAAGDCILHAAPLSHGSGLYNFAHLQAGVAQVVPESGGFDAGEVLGLCRQHRGVAMFAAPTIVKRLTEHAMRHGANAPGLKTIVYGGGPMYVADLKLSLQTFGDKFVQIYGQGESPMTITVLARQYHQDIANPHYEARLASVGIAQRDTLVRVRDSAGGDLPAGEIGEICVQGPTVMSGYWRDAEASERTLRDGWLWTGDMGSFDEDGFLTLKDRSKDLIISGGSNIYPREVEEVLLRHPAVKEAAVVGRQDAEWGEVVVAFVVTSAAVSTASLDEWCLAQIARFKRPKEYRFVAELPKNNYGKVLKTELRRLL